MRLWLVVRVCSGCKLPQAVMIEGQRLLRNHSTAGRKAEALLGLEIRVESDGRMM